MKITIEIDDTDIEKWRERLKALVENPAFPTIFEEVVKPAVAQATAKVKEAKAPRKPAKAKRSRTKPETN